MDYSSSLDPVDPQIPAPDTGEYIPALGYLDTVKEITDRDGFAPADVVPLKSFGLVNLALFEQALDLSRDLFMKKWLVEYKFRDWKTHRKTKSGTPVIAEEKETLVEKIAIELGNHVEDLAPDDRIRTADGRETTVKWFGQQGIPTRFLHPKKINPICITTGALVNDSSICQVEKMSLDGFTYCHVETEAHELLLAENCPAESFIDYAGRDSFVNGEDRHGMASIREMDLPRISPAWLIPEVIRNRLAKWAEASLTA